MTNSAPAHERQVAAIEDETAIVLTARESVVQLGLLVRAKARRGYLDQDEAQNATAFLFSLATLTLSIVTLLGVHLDFFST
jgi:hypothetical protein